MTDPFGPARLLAFAAALLLLVACAPAPLRPVAPADERAQREREAQLATETHWGLIGRIAVFDGEENGSGRIEWRQAGDRFEILLSAPVSRQSWRLTGGPEGALLEGLEGGPRTADSAERLLQEEAGWSVPLDRLRAWARGVRGDSAAAIVIGEDGLPAMLVEDGWKVQYRDWHAESTPALPRRVFANKGSRRVRLLVERWLDGSEVVAGDAPAGGASRHGD